MKLNLIPVKSGLPFIFLMIYDTFYWEMTTGMMWEFNWEMNAWALTARPQIEQ